MDVIWPLHLEREAELHEEGSIDSTQEGHAREGLLVNRCDALRLRRPGGVCACVRARMRVRAQGWRVPRRRYATLRSPQR